jgi:hypothetical protein
LGIFLALPAGTLLGGGTSSVYSSVSIFSSEEELSSQESSEISFGGMLNVSTSLCVCCSDDCPYPSLMAMAVMSLINSSFGSTGSSLEKIS